MMYEDYARRAIELGHKGITCLEHGYQGNFLKCWELTKDKKKKPFKDIDKKYADYNLKFLFGVEAYWVPDRKVSNAMNAHVCVFARNERGRRQITSALSTANEDGFYYVPRLDFELFKTFNPEDVLITTACVAYWGRPDRETGSVKWYEGIDELFRAMHGHFGKSLYLEVQAHDTKWQKEINRRCIKYSDELGIPLIAGLDSHYIYPHQAQERKWLREESHIKMGDGDHELDGGVYEDYPSEEELVKRFEKQGVLSSSQIKDSMDVTDVFMTFEDFDFDRKRKIPTIYPQLTQEERNQLYLKTVWDAWDEYKKDINEKEWPKYQEAIREETEVVTSTNTSDYFLLDYEIVKLGKKKGGLITPSGRGSGSSFFTNTLLGFSTLDRISLPVKLYPSRFISKERLMAGQLPDLDLNLSEPAIFAEAQKEILGDGHAFPMIAYGTLKEKAAFRMFARAKGLSMEVQNEVSAQIEEYELEKKHNPDDEIDIMEFISDENAQYIEGAKPYKGIIVSASQAPCGYLLYQGDIRAEIGIVRVSPKNSSKYTLCTVIDGYTADAFGYVKNDLLKVDVVSVNALAMKLAGLPNLTSRQVIDLTKYDKATWEIFKNGFTMGINQCERSATTQKLMRYKPQSLKDLSAFVAAVRPSFKSKINMFLDRKKFMYNIPSFDELINDIDESGSSWLLYQESLMACLNLAGFPMDSTYGLIKAISRKDKDKIAPHKEKFLSGFKEHVIENDGFSPEDAEKTAGEVWQIMEDASQYGFNACVSGNTKFCRLGKTSLNRYTVEEMYKIMHDREYASKMEAINLSKKYRKFGYGFTMSLYPDGYVRKNEIIDIRPAGKRVPTYRVTTESGAEVVCSASHKFPTPDGKEKMLSHLNCGDAVLIRNKKWPALNELPRVSRIVSIKFEKHEQVYDVEMAAPAHTFTTDSGLIVCNSHAACVSIDALYGAYLKAHYPLSYYTAILTVLSEKGDKDRIALVREEMSRAFGITMSPCKFGQDNREYFMDKEKNTISDAISSVKNMSKIVADELYKMKDMKFDNFTSVLYHLDTQTKINSAQIEILIRMGYFEIFGSKGKLMTLFKEFKEGEIKFSKNHVLKTQLKRLESLAEFEKRLQETDLSPEEQMKFEVEYYGTPLSIIPSVKNMYAVVEIDDKYSPKIRLYNIARGTTGVMKIKKADYQKAEIKAGDCIILEDWEKRKAYHFVDGKPVVKPDVYDLWITRLKKCK